MNRQSEAPRGRRLELKGLYAGYGPKIVLKNINLTAKPGSITVIMGRNGAGKTTVLKTIAGLTRVFRGHVILGRVDLTSLPPWRRNVSLLLNPQPLIDSKTVAENLELVARLAIKRGIEPLDPFDTARKVGIDSLLSLRASDLSRGQRQLVGLTQVFISNSDLVLMDEPFANLDYHYRMRISKMIVSELVGRNIPVVMTTHEISDVILTGNTSVAILENGTVTGTVTERDLVEGNIIQLKTPLPNLFMSYVDKSSPIAEAIRKECRGPETVADGALLAFPPSSLKVVLRRRGSGDCRFRGLLLGVRLVAPGMLLAFVDLEGEIIVAQTDTSGIHSHGPGTEVCVKLECGGLS